MDMKDRRKNIYISKQLEKQIDAVFAQMQREGYFGKLETPDSNLAAIFDYALRKVSGDVTP